MMLPKLLHGMSNGSLILVGHVDIDSFRGEAGGVEMFVDDLPPNAQQLGFQQSVPIRWHDVDGVYVFSPEDEVCRNVSRPDSDLFTRRSLGGMARSCGRLLAVIRLLVEVDAVSFVRDFVYFLRYQPTDP